jgi:hypothetical protein
MDALELEDGEERGERLLEQLSQKFVRIHVTCTLRSSAGS